LSETLVYSLFTVVNRNPLVAKAGAETSSPLVPGNKPENGLERTASTWIAYLALIYFALVLNCLGPVTSLVRAEHQLTYAEAGLLGSGFASGLIVASLVTPMVSRRLGSWKTLALAGAGLISGCSLICLGKDYPVILAGAFLAGTLGSLVISEVPLVLAQEHQSRSMAAVTEANALGSASAVFGPPAIGLAERWHIGWRTALVAPVLLAVAGAVIFAIARPQSPCRDRTITIQKNRLGKAFWLNWFLLFFSVAAEFAIIFWATDYFRQGEFGENSETSGVLTLFFLTMCTGRAIGGRLTLRVPSVAIILGSLVVALCGSFFYCATSSMASRLAGLALLGFGIANLYPTFLTLAISRAKPHEKQASAKMTLASGLAILVFPFVLGGVADQSGLSRAQLLIPCVLVGVLSLFLCSLRLEKTLKPKRAENGGLGELDGKNQPPTRSLPRIVGDPPSRR
jgi:fucose permease